MHDLPDVHFTDRELDLMLVLWDLGSGTVTEVREMLGESLAYTTVLTVLQTLEGKGFVRHREEGKAYRYTPLVDRDAAGASAVRRLLSRMFSGSVQHLVAHALRDPGLTRDELLRVQDLLDARLRERRD